MALKDPKEIVSSIVNGAVGAVQFLPRAAENVAKVAESYATSVNKNINDFKAKMPDEPAVVPRLLGSVIGETVGAAIGVIEGLVGAASETAKDIKSQIKKGTD